MAEPQDKSPDIRPTKRGLAGIQQMFSAPEPIGAAAEQISFLVNTGLVGKATAEAVAKLDPAGCEKLVRQAAKERSDELREWLGEQFSK